MLKPLSVAFALMSACSLPVIDTASAAVAMSAGEAGDVAMPPEVEQAQFIPFIFGGRNYCWYDSGWRGPGWYWCGYAFRQGYGWGGGYGFNGWGGRDAYQRRLHGGGHPGPGPMMHKGGMGGMPHGGKPMGGHMGGMHMGGGHMGGMHMGGGHMGGGMHMGGGGGHGGGGHGGGGHKP